jgi:hypothetical protein
MPAERIPLILWQRKKSLHRVRNTQLYETLFFSNGIIPSAINHRDFPLWVLTIADK